MKEQVLNILSDVVNRLKVTSIDRAVTRLPWRRLPLSRNKTEGFLNIQWICCYVNKKRIFKILRLKEGRDEEISREPWTYDGKLVTIISDETIPANWNIFHRWCWPIAVRSGWWDIAGVRILAAASQGCWALTAKHPTLAGADVKYDHHQLLIARI